MVSDAVSHGSIFGWRLKSVNQLHAPSSTSRSGLRFMPHLHRAVLAQQLRGVLGAIGSRCHPYAKVAAAETRIVADRHREPWNSRQRKKSEHGGERADQDHDFEAEDRV